MTTTFDFAFWLSKLSISGRAEQVISLIRQSQPSRKVKSSKGAVIGSFPSRKMRNDIQFESHKNELPFIHELEHDPAIVEFYDQPPAFKLEYQSAAGKKMAHLHTPDFFVVHTDYAGWIECKTETQLLNLSIKQPNRFQRDESGVWRCPPGEKYAEQLGLRYSVRTDKQINWIYQRNIEYLDDYYRVDKSCCSETSKHEILHCIKNKVEITLQELFDKTSGKATKDEIFSLISTDEIYIDLYEYPLVEPEKIKVFVDQTAAQAFTNIIWNKADIASRSINFVEVSAGRKLNWDGQIWRIANVGNRYISLIDETFASSEVPISIFEELVRLGNIEGVNVIQDTSMPDEVRERLAFASPENLRKANKKYEILTAYFYDLPLPEQVSPRTLRDWRRKFKLAENAYGYGYLGLLEKPRSGNKTPRISTETIENVVNFITDEYENIKQKKKFEVYAQYRVYCEENYIQTVSYKYFVAAIKQRSGYEQTLKRQGKRVAYQEQPFYFNLEQNTPQHGERPFHIAHLDHTELDSELVDSVTGENYGRPWLTLLIDAFSRLILAVYLSFDEPSYRSNMMVVRECVRRHGRLPQILMVDGGKDLNGVYFDTLMGMFECTKKVRPPAEPRFGSLIERIFFTTNTQFVHNLQGNTQIMKNVRQVTKSINPKNLALWNLYDCYEYLSKYCYEVYPSLKHSTLGRTPAEMFSAGNKSAGERRHKLIPYNEDFKFLTLPFVKTKGGTAKVVPSYGVKIQNKFFWTASFNHPEVEGTRVAVRYDPFNVGHAFAFVNGQWIECFSEHFKAFDGCSEKLISVASIELKKRLRLTTQDIHLNAFKLANFLNSVENHEKLLKQKKIDREQNAILSIINSNKGELSIKATLANEPYEDEANEVRPESTEIQDFSSETDIYGAF